MKVPGCQELHRFASVVACVAMVCCCGCVMMATQPMPEADGIAVGPAGVASTIRSGHARIEFTRTKSMLGMVVPHYLVDRGSGLTKNTAIVERKTYESLKGNFDKGRNVRYLAYDRSSTAQGSAATQDCRRLVGRARPDQASLPRIAAFIGTCKNGQTLVWERPPGNMRIEVITPGGDQAFAPHLEVEAGKTYRVVYYYARARFEVTPNP